MNRVAFVAGAVRNTGWATARVSAREGHDVILSSRTGTDAAAAAAKRAAEFTDIRKPDAVKYYQVENEP